jgi:hypothetical protein
MEIDAYLPCDPGDFEVQGRKSPLLKEIKEGNSHHIAEVDNLLQSVGRHGGGSERKRNLAGEKIEGRPHILRKAPASMLNP